MTKWIGNGHDMWKTVAIFLAGVFVSVAATWATVGNQLAVDHAQIDANKNFITEIRQDLKQMQSSVSRIEAKLDTIRKEH